MWDTNNNDFITKDFVNWMNQIYFFVNIKCYRPYVDTNCKEMLTQATCTHSQDALLALWLLAQKLTNEIPLQQFLICFDGSIAEPDEISAWIKKTISELVSVKKTCSHISMPVLKLTFGWLEEKRHQRVVYNKSVFIISIYGGVRK